jgi:hypothetical protein
MRLGNLICEANLFCCNGIAIDTGLLGEATDGNVSEVLVERQWTKLFSNGRLKSTLCNVRSLRARACPCVMPAVIIRVGAVRARGLEELCLSLGSDLTAAFATTKELCE